MTAATTFYWLMRAREADVILHAMTERRRKRILRQHVQTDRLLGVDAVPLGEPVAPVPTAAGSASRSSTVASAVRSNAAPLLATVAEPLPRLDREGKLRVLEAMRLEEVQNCRKCELCRGRLNTVFGEGDVDASILFIGEGPGQNEDEQGRPFVGRAGELLDKMIAAMGLKREQVYIANIVKCRPPNNRAPTPIEVETCWPYLYRQIATIRPKVIVTLGGPAAKAVLGTSEGITRLRGTWHSYVLGPGEEPIPVMPTFHPAYVLRNYTPEVRGKVWSDLQQVMKLVGL